LVSRQSAWLFHLVFGSSTGVDRAHRPCSDSQAISFNTAGLHADSHPLPDSIRWRAFNTYAAVDIFKWVRDFFAWQRNNYDKLGHFTQGFVPAIIAR
jgi:hypothetical protein